MRVETRVDGRRDWIAVADFKDAESLNRRLEWLKARILLEKSPGRHEITVDGKVVWQVEILNTNESPDEASQRYGAMGKGVPRRKKKRKKMGKAR